MHLMEQSNRLPLQFRTVDDSYRVSHSLPQQRVQSTLKMHGRLAEYGLVCIRNFC